MVRTQPALPLAPREAAPPAAAAPRRPAARSAPASRELWCAALLPALLLEVRPAPADRPFAVFDPGCREILATNAAAAAAGVRPGQSTTTAWALCPGLGAFVRDPKAEEKALERLAGWAAQFSPRLAREPQGVVFEVGASRRLFGGLDALLDQVRGELGTLGYRHALGVAPTPLAALWRARASLPEPVTDPGGLAGALAPLPLAAMALDARTRAALHGLGLRRIGELMRLPRAGLARRYGAGLIETLDRALGRRPDPRPAWQPAAVYEGAVELPVETTALAWLELAYRRLTAELAGFVCARDAAVRRLALTLETERQILETALDCQAPLREAERLLALIVTRLERIALPAPVRRVALRAKDFAVHRPERALALPEDDEPAALAPVLARLVARLGDGAVVRLAPAPDHRPERASRILRVGEVAAAGIARPGWPLLLLAAPERLPGIAGRPGAHGRLEPIAGPERIESGWWDGGDIARDYYRMQAPGGATHWVFRDRKRGGWYRHGDFV